MVNPKPGLDVWLDEGFLVEALVLCLAGLSKAVPMLKMA
jgi:hypothetical protein